jgi:DNA-binding PadR family transcriptional regulator
MLGFRYNGSRAIKDNLSSFVPLSPAALHILLALAGEDMHGYGIMQEVTRQSEGVYKLGPGTLYDNLQRLMDQGMVTEISSDGPRRRTYRLSPLGRKVLSTEISRLEGVVREARVHLRRV